MTDRMINCGTCRYFAPAPGEPPRAEGPGLRLGQCRFNPPVVVGMNRKGAVDSAFPFAVETAWCGKHPQFARLEVLDQLEVALEDGVRGRLAAILNGEF